MVKIIPFFRHLNYKLTGNKEEQESSGFRLAEFFASIIYPKFTHTEHAKIWLEDDVFFDYYEKFNGKTYRSADRKYFLNSLLALVEDLPGDTSECGVYNGATSYIISKKFQCSEKIHHAFDSFEGLSQPTESDGAYWHASDLNTTEQMAKENLRDYGEKIRFYKGWIPDRFADVKNQNFCFVHIDVDLYQPTLDSLAFFYPRVVKGGVILCDDYGFGTCPGAKKAFDGYMKDKPEKIVHVPTGQAFIIKK